jgi:hypothetical protein
MSEIASEKVKKAVGKSQKIQILLSVKTMNRNQETITSSSGQPLALEMVGSVSQIIFSPLCAAIQNWKC